MKTPEQWSSLSFVPVVVILRHHGIRALLALGYLAGMVTPRPVSIQGMSAMADAWHTSVVRRRLLMLHRSGMVTAVGTASKVEYVVG